MFFVFGWGRQTVKRHGAVGIFHCQHCNNDKHWVLFSRKTWFTLFFIPVIPYSSEHLMICPICNHGVKLDRVKFEEYKAIAEGKMDLINKKITQDEHAERIEEISASQPNSNLIEENTMTGKTETQLNYIRQMKEIEQERRSKNDVC